MKSIEHIVLSDMPVNGTLELDYNNPEHEAYFLKRFGGKEFLQSKYPNVYEAFLKAKNRSGYREDNKDDMQEYGLFLTPIGKKSEEKTEDDIIKGSEEECSQYAFSESLFHAEHPTPVIILGVLRNLTDPNEEFDHFNLIDESAIHISKDLKTLFSNITRFNNQEIQAFAEWHFIDKKGVHHSFVSNSTSYLVLGAQEIVSEFHIEDPYSKYGNNPIIGLYDRDPAKGEQADYSYGPDRVQKDNDEVNVLFPIKGNFTVADNINLIGFPKGSHTEKPELLYSNDGSVQYNYSYDEIANFFTIDKDNPKRVNFCFDDNWRNRINVSHYGTNVNLLLRASFFYTVECPSMGMKTDIGLSIIGQGTAPQGGCYYNAEGPTVFVPPMNVRWGCFHKDTMIMMADGSSKVISDIKIGDKVLTTEGDVSVTNTFSGPEKKLIHIELESGDVLDVTQGHAIGTKRGVIPAKDLNAGDELLLKSGIESRIKYLYEIDYNDVVYNIELDGKLVFANNIQAGDFTMQNSFKNCKETSGLTAEQKKVSVELKALYEELFQ